MKRTVLRLLAILLTSLLLFPSLIGTANADSNPWLDRRVLNIAHQGGEIEAASNTLFALKTSERTGADVLEFDVHATADGELVAIHDNTVDRTTNGSGRVDELTLEQLEALDAAYWFVPDCGTCPDQPVDEYAYRGFATVSGRSRQTSTSSSRVTSAYRPSARSSRPSLTSCSTSRSRRPSQPPRRTRRSWPTC